CLCASLFLPRRRLIDETEADHWRTDDAVQRPGLAGAAGHGGLRGRRPVLAPREGRGEGPGAPEAGRRVRRDHDRPQRHADARGREARAPRRGRVHRSGHHRHRHRPAQSAPEGELSRGGQGRGVQQGRAVRDPARRGLRRELRRHHALHGHAPAARRQAPGGRHGRDPFRRPEPPRARGVPGRAHGMGGEDPFVPRRGSGKSAAREGQPHRDPGQDSRALISFSHLGKQYGRQVLFIDASFQLNPGEKVGLVGPNGAGKTTLFRLIVGEETADEGEVSVARKLTVGYFRQDVEEMSGRSVLDEAIAGSGRVGDLHHELEALQQAMGDPARADEMDAILARFGEVQEAYDHLGGYALESQAREVLHGLGFDDERIDGDVGALSGGWKMRVAMARVLLGKPDVLLMDEPTNHLDIESIIWLEQFLKSHDGALLMTSHDREFMNRIVSKIFEIDGGEITQYSGNYDFYERERALREANREAAYARQQAMLAKEQRFIERFKTHAAKAAQVQSRIKALDKIEKIELPKRRTIVKFDFRDPPRSGDQVAVIEGLSKSYGKRVIYDGFDLTIRRGERWAVMGRNGAGKTTLLKMIAGVSAPDAGSVRLGASLT